MISGPRSVEMSTPAPCKLAQALSKASIFEMITTYSNLTVYKRYKLKQLSYRSYSYGYIDVGDGCWWRDVLVKIWRCWWWFWSFKSPTSTIFQHQRQVPTLKRCHQDLHPLTNIQKLSLTSLTPSSRYIWLCMRTQLH